MKLDGEQRLISTENQLSGKGQRNNQWRFYPGSLAFSFTMLPPSAIQLAAMEVGVLFCQYVDEDIKLKWPNDLMFQGKKCGGILCQFVDGLVIVGVGINIGEVKGEHDFKFLPGAFSWTARNLQKRWPLQFYQFVLENRLASDLTLELFQKYCDHLNQTVSIKGMKGIFKGLGKNGEAIIMDGQLQYQIINGSLLYH